MSNNPPVHGQSGSGSGLDVMLAILGLDGGYGIWGDSDIGAGVVGSSASKDGVAGLSHDSVGVSAMSFTQSALWASSQKVFGVYGETGGPSYSSGVHGESAWGAGVSGRAVGADSGPGVVGISDSSFGVRGQSGAANLLPPVGGGKEFQICGVQGSSDNGTGVRGDGATHVGVRGRSLTGTGVFGSCQDQQNPHVQTTEIGVHGSAPRSSPDSKTGPFAGVFDGDVKISGNLYVGDRLIAYPTRASKFNLASIGPALFQSVQDGVSALDANGEAIVALADGFEDAHTHFHYQLTAIGGSAPNLHIAKEIKGNKFKISGGAGHAKVSWQVTGTAKDGRLKLHAPAPEPIDEKQAQEYKRRMEDFARLVETNKERSRQLAKQNK